MSRAVLQPSQQKLAEKLTILNDRGVGMLTRIYNIKKVTACDVIMKRFYLIVSRCRIFTLRSVRTVPLWLLLQSAAAPEHVVAVLGFREQVVPKALCHQVIKAFHILQIFRCTVRAQRTQPTGRSPQDTAPQDAAPQDAAPQDAAHRTLPTGRCPRDVAHRTLAHRSLPTGRSPQDTAPQDAAPQGAAPQDAAPQDAAHRTLPTGRCRAG
ncbi:hypothetical protein NFI96_003492 [Prochilodus magdalenae]|nr:hypothetical protein NFI96_003492 [Prochilodus magdalenae]